MPKRGCRRGLQLGPDTHGEMLLMLPTMCALRSGGVSKFWRAQVGALFRAAGVLSVVGRRRLLLLSRELPHGGHRIPEPDIRAACDMAAAIRSSFALRICPGTMFSRPSPDGCDFIRRAVPFAVIGRVRRAVLDQFSRLTSVWFQGLDWKAAADASSRSSRAGDREGALATMRIYEITSAIAQLQRVLSQTLAKSTSHVQGGAGASVGEANATTSTTTTTTTTISEFKTEFKTSNLFRAFWMICRFACVKENAPGIDGGNASETSIRVALLVRALSNDLVGGQELQGGGDPWCVAREIIRGLRKKKRELGSVDGDGGDDQFQRCVAAIVNFLPCGADDRENDAVVGSDNPFNQFGLQEVLSDLTLNDDEIRSFCHTMSTAQDGALDDYASLEVVVATMACCVYTGDFWSGVVPRIVDRLRRRACPIYLEAFVRHVSAQLFTQDMLTNYLLFVCHNVPFATKLRFLKMCIDRASEFCTSRMAAAAVAAMVALPGAVEEEEDEEEEEEDGGGSGGEGGGGEGVHALETAQVEHNNLDAMEEEEIGGGGPIGGSVAVEQPLLQYMTSAGLAQGLLNSDRVALLGRSSNKSGDFWRWCIGKMVSSSAQQWQHTLSALSMHR